ncbi:MAG: hypothetical protein E3J72_04950 [Planctomycetota bacterium]|nr:MAG: hypothetical protein E3J72_04950 [Planctomycetota bacterium]
MFSRHILMTIAVLALALYAFPDKAAGGEPDAVPKPLPDDIIYLVGGDVIKGSFVRVEDGKIFYKIRLGGKYVEESLPESKVRRIRRLKPDGTNEVIYPPTAAKRLLENDPRRKKNTIKKPAKPKPKPVTKETRDEYAKRMKELKARQAKSEYELGLWCEKNGMENESKTHYARALELDEDNEEYKLKCGYKKVGGKLVPPAEADKAVKEETEQEKIDREYKDSVVYEKFAGLWVTRGLQKFIEGRPDDATRLTYVTALSRLAQRRNAYYDDLSTKEKRLIRFLAPLEQKRICPRFNPEWTPAPPERGPAEFGPDDLKREKSGQKK